METMQQAILDRIETKINDHPRAPWRAVHESGGASNIGTVAIIDDRTLDVVGRIRYDFQAGYFGLYFRVGSEGGSWSSKGRKHFDGKPGKGNADAIDAVVEFLSRVAAMAGPVVPA